MNMKKLYRIVFIVAIFPFFFGSCSKDRDDELSLFGNWVEAAPVPQRTEIYFYPENELSIKFSGEAGENYYYKIEGNAIFLSPDRNFEDEETLTELFFKQIDGNTFQISDLYASIPENEPTFIIFERETSI